MPLDTPLPMSADEFITTLRTHIEKVRTTTGHTRSAKANLIHDPLEPTCYEILYVLARTLHARTLQLLITCQNQHMGIKDNCEVEVERRLSYTHAPDDEPPPF